MRYAIPNPERINGDQYLRIHVPNDIAEVDRVKMMMCGRVIFRVPPLSRRVTTCASGRRPCHCGDRSGQAARAATGLGRRRLAVMVRRVPVFAPSGLPLDMVGPCRQLAGALNQDREARHRGKRQIKRNCCQTCDDLASLVRLPLSAWQPIAQLVISPPGVILPR